MAKYSFDVVGSQLIVSLVPVLDDAKPTSMSYLTPSFKIGNGKINSYESGQPKQSFLFTEIGEIDGVAPTDLQDAFDKITALTANFNGGGTAPSKVYVASISQTGTSNPVSTIYKNTAGFLGSFTRLDTGIYLLDLPAEYVANKIVSSINLGLSAYHAYIGFNGTSIQITCLDDVYGTGTPTDDALFNAEVTIELFD